MNSSDQGVTAAGEDHKQLGRPLQTIRIIVWRDGRVIIEGDPQAVKRFKSEWMKEGLPLGAILSLCG